MRGLLSLLALGALGASACAGVSQTEVEISQLRREMRAVRAELDAATASIATLEGKLTLLSARASAPEPRSKLPALPVVRLDPADASAETDESGALDDGSPPVVIKLGPGADDPLPVDHSVLKKRDPVLDRPRAGPDPAADYALALATLREKDDPSGARRLFEQFKSRHPDSDLADNVAYWLAECSFAESRHREAIDSFLAVIERFPRSPKIPDALLRVGQSWTQLGNREKAGEVFRRIAERYPDSEAAGTARAALGAQEKR